MLNTVYPAWFLFVWALVTFFISHTKLQRILTLILPILAGWFLLSIPDGTQWQCTIADITLTPFRIDALSRLFVLVFLVFAWASNLFAWHVTNRMRVGCAQAYAAFSIGAVLAGDLITLLVFWELMAITSVVLIWDRRTKEAYLAGWRFLLVHAAGGALLFGGIMLYGITTGSFEFNRIGLDIAGWLIMISFLLNAAVPPLHAWLPDAYPASSATGAVYLSAFTSKTAVYALIRGFTGTELLIWVGVACALYGVIYALMQNDIRRLLSYHLICQVGYMVVGIGIGTELAVNGATLHAINNVLYKGLLFMAAGAVLKITGKSTLTDLGGLMRSMPRTFTLFMIGAFAISGMPWLNGFISKGMIFSEVAHVSKWMELLLIASAAGTFLSIGIKIAYYAFIAPPKTTVVAKEATLPMQLSMLSLALICFVLGTFPALANSILPFNAHYTAYTPGHVLQSIQLLLWTTLAFLLIRSRFVPHKAITLDTDWIYRGRLVGMFVAAADGLSHFWARTLQGLRTSGVWLLNQPLLGVMMERVFVRYQTFWVTTSLVGIGLLLFNFSR